MIENEARGTNGDVEDSGQPRILVADHVGICDDTKGGLRGEAGLVNLLNTICDPLRVLQYANLTW